MSTNITPLRGTLETSAETGDTFSLPRTIQTAKMMIHALQTWARKNLPPDQGESVFDFLKKLEGLLVTLDTEMVEASIHIGIAEKYLKRARGVKS